MAAGMAQGRFSQPGEGCVNEFEKILVVTFGEHYDSSLYTLKYHLLDDIVYDTQRFGTVSVLARSSFWHFDVHIKLAYKKAPQKRQIKAMEAVDMGERSYKRALSYCKTEG